MPFEPAPAKWEKFKSGSLNSNGVRIARLDGWSVVALPTDAVGHLIRASAAALEGNPTPAQGQIMASLKEENVELASATAGSERGTCSLQDLQRGLRAAQEELDGVRAPYEATDAGR
jgi:hypothetical protein